MIFVKSLVLLAINDEDEKFGRWDNFILVIGNFVLKDFEFFFFFYFEFFNINCYSDKMSG